MSTVFYDDIIKILHLGKNVFLPYTLASGYITVDHYGNVEAWYGKPYFSGYSWNHDSEVGVDIYTIDRDLFQGEAERMIFSADTGKRLA